jgi:hypothetical protein
VAKKKIFLLVNLKKKLKRKQMNKEKEINKDRANKIKSKLKEKLKKNLEDSSLKNKRNFQNFKIELPKSLLLVERKPLHQEKMIRNRSKI